jgi:hypothetical protein
VWWIEKRISVEREMACDDAVLAETANPRGYATCLVSLLEKSLAQRRWSMVQAAVHRAREASLRLAQILDKNRPAATRVWKPALGIVGVFSIFCLALLPLAPQFVAFDRGARASRSDPVDAAAVSPPSFEPLLQPSVKAAAVVTAGLQTGESSSLRTTGKGAIAKVVHARVHAHDVAGHQLASAVILSAPLNAAPARERVVETSASGDQETVPEFRTLIFIETTQYGNSDSAVWRVQVWRVMLVRTVRDTLAGVPVAHSI